ncbi:arylamine N-acetyltransferase family protein [Roseiterribacter gracilis]|uniref:N-hydroxyarylamine O-acetyltransferase n=1 Tax=Roseiterribacter gracilis TaxID=2812848 RepID=A0A8S8XI94_9PROT|nr:N-hydroxyarylamine O-acetyltransferase [Rhodospirillales bacterium TMPK1]
MLDLDSYFARIGYDGPRSATLDVLQHLQLLHPIAIPFENLDSLHGRTPLLDAEALQAKLVDSKRGGYCFEQNTLLRLALEALGFRVTSLLARVCWGLPAGAETARGHMLLRVDIGDEAWIADVGFGSVTLTAPIRLAYDIEQATPHETFRLVRCGDRFEQQVRFDQTWLPVYRFGLLPEGDDDIAMSNWYVATHPRSNFVRNLIAARPTLRGRISLAGGALTIREGGAVEKRTAASRDELLQMLHAQFGIDVPAWATLDALFA